MSRPPYPPNRSDQKKSVRQSPEIYGEASEEEVLTGGPKFTGVSQGSSFVARLEIHMSRPPDQPARVEEWNDSDKPSAETLGS